jgi:cytidine deaminase
MKNMAPNELSAEEQRLIQAAREIRVNAYARFSQHQVGAAVLSQSGRVFPGVNVESGSYGLTVCAERVAVFNAVTAGERDLIAVAVASPDERIWYPCGACRQVLSEFSPKMIVLAISRTGEVVKTDMQTLLPHRFAFHPPPNEL